MKTDKICRCRLVGSEIKIGDVVRFFEGENIFVDRDLTFFQVKMDNRFFVIFDFGVLVEWGGELQEDLLRHIMEYNDGSNVFTHEYVHYGFSKEKREILNDVVYFEGENIQDNILLAYSFALAQNHKLSFYESMVTETIDKSIYIPNELAQTGKIKLDNKKIAQLRGELFLINSDINLGFELLDTPNYFWENPNQNKFYQEMANYLELGQRINIVNKKIQVISELLTMLSDEQKHRDSSFLERVIIYLILFEVVMFLIHDIFKLF